VNAPSESRFLILITTSTYRASAYLEAGARLGVPLTIASERTQSLAMANPRGHLTLDFLAPANATARIVDFARGQPIRAVVAPDDDGAILGAMAADALGLIGNPVRAVTTARDKLDSREALLRAGLPSPVFRALTLDDDASEVAGEVSYPCVLKPVFLSASRGVIRADDPAGFVNAFERVAALLRRPEVQALGGERARLVLVEDFIPGDEVAVEGIVTDGRVRVLAIFDKPDPMDGPFFEETILVTPSRHPLEMQAGIADAVQRGIEALGLRHGPVHAELRVGDRGCWIIEIAPRSIGGLCSRTLRFTGGETLESLILRHAAGEDVSSIELTPGAAGVMMIPMPGEGVLRSIDGDARASGVAAIEEIHITVPPGQTLVPPPEGDRYLGFIFARATTPDEVESALREAHAHLRFTLDVPQPTETAGR
jgi:biotin carboxylase